MTVSLGLDIGSNSVGSAWVDTENKIIEIGVSVFPAGVDETETKRGAPLGQKRRGKRSQRRSLARRAARKRALRRLLTSAGLLPSDPVQLTSLFQKNPWELRAAALQRALTPHEFGRVLVHLNQRRGALGIHLDSEDQEDDDKSEEAQEKRKVKAGMERLRTEMKKRGAQTIACLMIQLTEERRKAIANVQGKSYQEPIRNRQYRLPEALHLYADRRLIREEFQSIWTRQKSFQGELAALLTDELRSQLDDPSENTTWRHRGILFGQRRTYWNTGTLGRCDLEPSARRAAFGDMYAQEFRVLETVNNIRIQKRGEDWMPLDDEQRANVLQALRTQKSGSIATIRKALGIEKKQVKEFYRLNLEADPDREINTDWFYREIIHGVFGEGSWKAMTDRQRDSVNAGFLKFDPDLANDAERLRAGAADWWGLSPESTDKLIASWKARPNPDKRVNLSRRALLNLLPYVRAGLTITEARQRFAQHPESGATPEQRSRYGLKSSSLTKADRHFLQKHPNFLPPAPLLANPVVRKAIHEVRRHLIAYLRKFRRKPDRIVIEMVRSAKQPEKVRNRQLALNRNREKIRKQILEDFELSSMTLNQQRAAVERVLLCRQQGGVCAYSGKAITDRQAALGHDLETDHIVPYSACGDNSLNNKVLCYRNSNRGKGNQTPKQWLSNEEFALLEARFAHFEKCDPPKEDYFTKKQYARKWENLHREVRPEDEWASSQLTDTAYASRQVASYLADAVYGAQAPGKQYIFFSKGSYTAMLRKDW
jgi:CRISPR-associated endonuclease Csn1